MSATATSNVARRSIAAALAIAFTILHTVSLSDSDAIFQRGVGSFLWSDIGEWTDATQIGAMRGDLRVDDLELAPYTRNDRQPRIPNAHWHLKRQKHPLYAPVSHFVYRAARGVAAPWVGNDAWTWRHELVALKFPAALFGGLATAGFFWYASSYAGLGSGLLFALFFGVSFGKWFFSSVTDTYSLQGMICVVFAAQMFSCRRSLLGVFGLAATTTIAILIGVNNILLVPVVMVWLIVEERNRDLLIYGVALGVAVLSAYAAMAIFVEDPVRLFGTIDTVSKQVEMFSLRSHTSVGGPLVKVGFATASFVLLSVAAAPAAEEIWSSFAVLRAYGTSVLSAFFIVGYALLFAVIVRKLVRASDIGRDVANRMITHALWAGLILVYYSQFNALQSILYSTLFLVPFMGLLFECFAVRSPSRAEMALLGLLVAVTFAGNLSFLERFVP